MATICWIWLKSRTSNISSHPLCHTTWYRRRIILISLWMITSDDSWHFLLLESIVVQLEYFIAAELRYQPAIDTMHTIPRYGSTAWTGIIWFLLVLFLQCSFRCGIHLLLFVAPWLALNVRTRPQVTETQRIVRHATCTAALIKERIEFNKTRK